MDVTEAGLKNEKTIRVISFAIIIFGIIVRVIDYFYNRSLFLDEAFLAKSLVQRGYLDLFKPLDYTQGAPAGYLLIVKTFVYMFGASEYALRLASLLSGIAAVYMFYIVLAKVFKDSRPWLGTAVFSVLPFLVYYSIELKPYMMDGLLTLVSVYVFHLAITYKIKPWAAALYCAAVLWFSFPAIFTVGSFCIIWFFYSAVNKDKKALIISFLIGLAALVSFALLYATIYQNLGKARKIGFYPLISFPLIPRGMDDLRLIYLISKEYFGIFGFGASYLMMLMSAISLSVFLWKRQLLFGIFFLVDVALLVLASGLGRYYMQARLLIFIVPLNLLFIMCYVNELRLKKKNAAWLLIVLMILMNAPVVKYLLPSRVYRQGLEINMVLEKLAKLEEKMPLYVYVDAIPSYEYKTGYKMGLNGTPEFPVEGGGVIYGSPYFEYAFRKAYSFESKIDSLNLKLNAAKITAHDKVRLLFANYGIDDRDALINYLSLYGRVTVVADEYKTMLYLFERKLQM